MKKVSISDAKNNLSALIDRVKAGVPVLIVDRGQPVAKLESVLDLVSDNDRLGRLVRGGIVRPGRSAESTADFTSAPPRAKRGVSAVRSLLDERREGR